MKCGPYVLAANVPGGVLRGVVLAVGCLSIALLSTGCGRTIQKEPPVQHPSASLGQLLQLIDLNTEPIKNVKAKMKIRASRATGEIKDGKELYDEWDVDGHIAMRRPDRIWMNAKKLFETILAGQSDGKKFWLALKPEKKLFLGSADVHTVRKRETTIIAFSPSDIANVLIADEFNLPDIRTFYEALPDEYVIYTVRLHPGGRARLYSKTWIERTSGQFNITKHQLFSVNASLRVEAVFYDYKKKSGLSVPRTVRVQWPGWKTNIVMDLYSIKINPPELSKKRSDKLFRYQIPKRFDEYERVSVDREAAEE